MLMEWKSCELIEMNLSIDHIHLIVSIPPKLSVLRLMGTVKGNTTIKIFKSYLGLKKKPYWGNLFGREEVVQIQLVLKKIRSRSASFIKKNKNE